MEYTEEAYQQLLKMRDLGKKNYDEERYSQSLVELRKADKALDEARKTYYKYPTDMNGEIVEHRRYDFYKADTMVTYLRDVMDGTREDPEMTDTMYELHGYKVKEEGDKFFEQWKQRICGSKGFWTPQTQVSIMMSSCPVCNQGLAGSVYRPRCSVCPWDSQE